MQVPGAYEEAEATLHALFSCCSGLKETPLHKNDNEVMKAMYDASDLQNRS